MSNLHPDERKEAGEEQARCNKDIRDLVEKEWNIANEFYKEVAEIEKKKKQMESKVIGWRKEIKERHSLTEDKFQDSLRKQIAAILSHTIPQASSSTVSASFQPPHPNSDEFKEKKKRVDAVLEMLNITAAANDLVDGERKSEHCPGHVEKGDDGKRPPEGDGGGGAGQPGPSVPS